MSRRKAFIYTILYGLIVLPLYLLFQFLNCFYGLVRGIGIFIGCVFTLVGYLQYDNTKLVFLLVVGPIIILTVIFLIPVLYKMIVKALRSLLSKYYLYKSIVFKKAHNNQTQSQRTYTQGNEYQEAVNREKNMDILNSEFQRIHQERERLEKEKQYFENEKKSMQKERDFFVGTNSVESVKKRYRDLVKIYHADVPGGDTETIAIINSQYENRLKNVGGV